MEPNSIYRQLAQLFEYPGADYAERCRSCAEEVSRISSEASPLLDEFLIGIAGFTVYDLQELYTRTFDLNPVCTLEVGWQLYGEDYSRGEFLVKMRNELRRYDVQESTELPDHLTHALALLRSLPPEEAGLFASEFVLPALDKMRAGWTKNLNAFASLLDATFILLKNSYGYDAAKHPMRIPALKVLP